MVLLTLAFLPGRLVEEGLHALAALPFAEVVSVRLNPRAGTAETVVEYREETPQWAIVAAHVLPEVVAVLAGVAVIAWWVVNGPLWWPATTLDFALLALFGAQYLALVIPTASDRDPTPEGEAP